MIFQCHDIRTNFHENLLIGQKRIKRRHNGQQKTELYVDKENKKKEIHSKHVQ